MDDPRPRIILAALYREPLRLLARDMSTTLELMKILDSSDLVPIYEYLCMKSNKALAIELVKMIKRIKSLEKQVQRLSEELSQLRIETSKMQRGPTSE